jgi:predicted hydrocarbon binding protein
MHGIIFSELRKYVDTTLGNGAWTAALADAGLANKLYLPIQEYPDADVFALVSSAARTTGQTIPAILEDFGEFIAPALLGLYRTLVRPEWKTLDLLENTEQTIHSVVRARNPGAKPAELSAVRVSPDMVDLTYTSQRKLCPVAKGIVRGVGKHFGETITIHEVACMHDGADACRMEVRVAA